MEHLSRPLSSRGRYGRAHRPGSTTRSSALAVAAVTLAVSLVGGAACGSTSTGTSSGDSDAVVEDAKALSSSKKEYIGAWTGPGTTLTISPEGGVDWKSDKGGVSSSYAGKLKKFKGDSLLIDALVEVNLVVTKAPHEDGGVWKMTMEGVEVTRVDRVANIANSIREVLAKQGPAIKELTCKGTAPEGENSTLDCNVVSENGEKAAFDIVVAEGNASTKAKAGEMLVFGGKINELFDRDFATKTGVEGLKGGCPNAIFAKKIGSKITCPAVAGDKQHGTVVATTKGEDALFIEYEP